MAGTLAMKHLWEHAAAAVVLKVYLLLGQLIVYHPAERNYCTFIQCRIFSFSFFCTGTNHKFISKGIQMQTFNISAGKINYDVCSSWQIQHAKGAWRYAMLIMRYYCEVLLSF